LGVSFYCYYYFFDRYKILDLLQKFKDSNDKKEKEVFNCMIRNLFEEYRFFPQVGILHVWVEITTGSPASLHL